MSIERIGREQLRLTSRQTGPRELPSAPLDVRILVFSAGLGGKDESADHAESRPRSTILRVKFPGYIEPGDVQNTITIMAVRRKQV